MGTEKVLKQKKAAGLVDGLSLLSKDLQMQIMKELLAKSFEMNLNSDEDITHSNNLTSPEEVGGLGGDDVVAVKRRGRPPKSDKKHVIEVRKVGRPPKSVSSKPLKKEAILTVGKRRGRPPKDKSVITEDDNENTTTPQEGLIKFFSGNDSRKLNFLTKLAASGVIPETKDGMYNTYNLKAIRGNKPRPLTVVDDGKEVEITPPPLIKAKSVNDLVIWSDFEKVLFDLKGDPYNAAASKDSKAIIAKERQIGHAKGLRRKHHTHREGLPGKDEGVPGISSMLAREILKNCRSFERHLGHTIDMSPASWVLPTAEPTEEFKGYIKDALLGKHSDFGRKERFALARLLLKSLGAIELALFDIAFK